MKFPLQVFTFTPVFNKADDSVDIHIDGDIVDASTQAFYESWFGDTTSVSFKSFRNSVNANPVSTYNIYINSGGGLVTDASAMHDFIIDLRSKGKTVNTEGRGLIASAATYILMAGEKPRMSKNSWFMIHNVSGGVYGDVDQVEHVAQVLRQFNDRSRDFYAEYTEIRKEDIAKMMKQETWMTAETAKEKNFIKEIVGEVVFTQKIAKDQWNYSDLSVLNAYNSFVRNPPGDENKSYIDQKLDDMKKYFTNLFAPVKDNVKVPDGATAQEIVNLVVDAVQNRMAETGEQLDTEVSEAVTNAFKGEAFQQAVAAAVQTANAQMVNDAVTQALKPLREEIVTIKGKSTTPEPKEVGEKPLGRIVTE